MRSIAAGWILSFLLFFSAELSAGAETEEREVDWDFISVTLFPGIPPREDVFPVYGVKLGLPLGFSASNGFLHGVGFALFTSEEKEVKGWQSALFAAIAERVEGFQSSLFWNRAASCAGLQLGLVNYAKKGAVQVGLLNFIEDSPLPFFPFVNVFGK